MPNSHPKYVSIVVPVFNESESLPALYGEIQAAMDAQPAVEYEVLFVDDGSTDGSFQVLNELHARDPGRVQVIRFRRNFGQTAAMAAGFSEARGDVVIPMDADLQNDPADIPKLLAALAEGYDVASGWRADRQDPFVSRRLPSILANGLISWMTGVHLHDYGCTLKAYRKAVAEDLRFYGEMHRFLPALATWTGARVTEVKVNHRARQHGQSKYGIGRTTRVVLDLLTVRFLMAYSTRPMQVFGRWGFYCLAISWFTGILAVVLKFTAGQNMTGNPWMYLCLFFGLGGLQLIGLGLLGEINVRTYYESQDKTIYTVRDRLGGEPDPPVA